jgi:hypothetical protein
LFIRMSKSEGKNIRMFPLHFRLRTREQRLQARASDRWYFPVDISEIPIESFNSAS